MEINLELDSFNKIYNAGEYVTGNIIISNNEKTFDFDSMSISLTGSYTIKNNKLNPPGVNFIKFFNKKLKVAENGKIQYGRKNTFPFKLPLIEESKEHLLLETYQGVLIATSYELVVDVIIKSIGPITSSPKKINLFNPNQGVREDLKKRIIPYEFEISPSTLEKIKINQQKVPNFKLFFQVDNTNCDLNQPFNGFIIVKESEIPIKSLELQFIRNETVFLPGGEQLTEISEIQNLQIGDGDVIKNIEIPLFMIFPRFFTCAMLENKIAKLSFEMNIIVVLNNGFVITENFPINTWRS